MAKNNTTKLDAEKLRSGDEREWIKFSNISRGTVLRSLKYKFNKDIAQEAVDWLEEKFITFLQSKPDFEFRCSVVSYLCTVGKNKSIRLQGQKSNVKIEYQDSTDEDAEILKQAENDIDTFLLLFTPDTEAMLADFIKTLNPEYQTIAGLCMNNLDSTQIAERLNLTNAQVGSKKGKIKEYIPRWIQKNKYSTLFAIFTWLTQFWKNRS